MKLSDRDVARLVVREWLTLQREAAACRVIHYVESSVRKFLLPPSLPDATPFSVLSHMKANPGN